MDFVPTHFNRRFDVEMGFCKIRAASTCIGGGKKQVCQCLLVCRKSSKWPSISLKSHNSWWELVLWRLVKAAVKSPDSPRPKTVQQDCSIIMTVLVSFFNVDGILHRELVPPGQTVNQQFYLNVLKRLCESLRWKRPEK
jgi:hypothetical protein